MKTSTIRTQLTRLPILGGRFCGNYLILGRYVFLGYVCLLIAFGRAFSIWHMQIVGFPVFITEIVLFVCLPLAWQGVRLSSSILRPFILWIFWAFFMMGMLYLAKGVLVDGNLMALRDIVLCVYGLFLPISLKVFSDPLFLRIFPKFLLVANIVAIIMARLFMVMPSACVDFLVQMRMFNFGLSFGMASGCLMCFINTIRRKSTRFFLFLLCAVNVYMIFVMGGRASWCAFLIQMLFVFFILRDQIRTLFLPGMLSLVIVFGAMGFLDFYLMPSPHNHVIRLKLGTVSHAVSNMWRILLPRNPVISELQVDKMKEPKTDTSKKIGEAKKISFDLEKKRGIDVEKNSLPSQVAVPDLVEKKLPKGLELNFFSHVVQTADLMRSESEDNDYNVVMSSLFWRLRVWSQAVQFGMENPLWGRGFGVFPPYKIYNNYTIEQQPKSFGVDSNVIPAHNHIVTIFYKMGFIGLAAFLFLNGYIFIFVLTRRRLMTDQLCRAWVSTALAGFVFWHVLAMWFDVIESPPTTVFLWILMGMMLAIIYCSEQLDDAKN